MTELKAGQVWRDEIGTDRKILAVGPEHVLYRMPGYTDYAPIEVFRGLAVSLIAPKVKHSLWVNVFRGANGCIFLRHAPDQLKAAIDAARRTDATRIACLKLDFEEGDGI